MIWSRAIPTFQISYLQLPTPHTDWWGSLPSLSNSLSTFAMMSRVHVAICSLSLTVASTLSMIATQGEEKVWRVEAAQHYTANFSSVCVACREPSQVYTPAFRRVGCSTHLNHGSPSMLLLIHMLAGLAASVIYFCCKCRLTLRDGLLNIQSYQLSLKGLS